MEALFFGPPFTLAAALFVLNQRSDQPAKKQILG